MWIIVSLVLFRIGGFLLDNGKISHGQASAR